MMIHCSFDAVDEFIPRVPKSRCNGEDNTIKRICVAPTIAQALNSIPQAGLVVENMQALRLPVIFHCYYLKADRIMSNEEVQKYVPDAKFSGEFWVMEKPKIVTRLDYEITDCKIWHSRDINGNEIVYIVSPVIKQVKKQSNVENFFKAFPNSHKEEIVRKIFKKHGFRTVMLNFDDEIIGKIKGSEVV